MEASFTDTLMTRSKENYELASLELCILVEHNFTHCSTKSNRRSGIAMLDGREEELKENQRALMKDSELF